MCAYAVPHPSEKQINVRVQTNGRQTAAQVLQEALETLRALCEHVKGTFEAAVAAHTGAPAAA
jgi:DNA-directed RNA polymerase I and III subunit RPAC2